MQCKRARDFGIAVGELPTGPRNQLSDVPGVTVGHCTVDSAEHKTGVTVILPGRENPFTHKLPAAAFVWNGFGKTAGLMQVQELGRLESPIALTNTLNVGLVHDALVEYLLRRCQAEGVELTSVNPLVCECNDATLNRIAYRAVGQREVFAAIEAARADFEEGDVGGGKGMICHGLKGGIGSASRVLSFDGKDYTLAVLAQTNHGRLADLTIQGVPVGAALARQVQANEADKGSCICVLATDLPLDSRQLGRAARRMSVGLARLGSYVGHGSGEVFLAFSTANPLESGEKAVVYPTAAFREEAPVPGGRGCAVDWVFRAAADAAQEAVLNALFAARTVTGWRGKTVYGLSELWNPGLLSTSPEAGI